LVNELSGEELKQEIKKGAEEKAGQALTEARAKAAVILSNARAEAERIVERRTGEVTKMTEQQEGAEAAKARMECSRKVLGVRSRYVEDAFSAAEQRVGELPSKDPKRYRIILSRLFSEAIEGLGEEGPEAVVRPQDRTVAEGILKELGRRAKGCTLSEEPLKAKGGVVVRSRDGRVFFVNTFESRFLRSRDEVRAKLEAALLKEG
jgi:vacuolar-type H+-ATPase subunit E/Vma4